MPSEEHLLPHTYELVKGKPQVSQRFAALFSVMRIPHWIKNGIVVFPVIFGMKYAEVVSWLTAGVAVLAFCFASSSVYILNDICDREADRLHPRKCTRPVASGLLSPQTAITLALIVMPVALSLGAFLGIVFEALLFSYIVLQLGYSMGLKHILLVDVFCLSIGFVLRAVAGAVAISVTISPWLIVCTFTIALFMGFSKRYNELITLDGITAAAKHRRTLAGYTFRFLSYLIVFSAGITLISYVLYAISPRTVAQFGTAGMLYTLPAVFYGMRRFALLSKNGRYSDPTDIILHDRPLQITIVLWLALSYLVVAYGASLPVYLQLHI